MAATFSMSGIILLLFITNFSFLPFYHCTASSSYTWKPLFSLFAEWNFLYLKPVAAHSGDSNLNAGTHGRIFRHHDPCRPISAHYKHGFICMYLPTKDLTICAAQSWPGFTSSNKTIEKQNHHFQALVGVFAILSTLICMLAIKTKLSFPILDCN